MATAEVARPVTRSATAAASAAASAAAAPSAAAPGDGSAPLPECGICFDTISTQGHLDTCKHSFCYTCIKTWLDECNTCPICQRRFTKLTKEELSAAEKGGTQAPPSRSAASTHEEKVSYRDNRGYSANALLGVPLNALISDMLLGDMLRGQAAPSGAMGLLFGVLSMIGPARPPPMVHFSGLGTRQDPIVLGQGDDEDDADDARDIAMAQVFNPFAPFLGGFGVPDPDEEEDEEAAAPGGDVCPDCGRVHARPRNLFGAPSRPRSRPHSRNSSASGGSSSSRRSGTRRRLDLGGSAGAGASASASASASAGAGGSAPSSATPARPASSPSVPNRRRYRARRQSTPSRGAGSSAAASSSAAAGGDSAPAAAAGSRSRSPGASNNARPTKRPRRSSRQPQIK